MPLPVHVAEATRGPCAGLIAGLPPRLGPGLARRAVATDGDRTAAWGTPPVTLACGAGPPDPTAEPLVIDTVAWVISHEGDVRVWTSQGRRLGVVVRVPDSYTSQAEQLTPLSDALATADPRA